MSADVRSAEIREFLLAKNSCDRDGQFTLISGVIPDRAAWRFRSHGRTEDDGSDCSDRAMNGGSAGREKPEIGKIWETIATSLLKLGF